MTIWKFSLQIKELNELEIPKGSRVLSCQLQKGFPAVWVLVPDEKAEKETRLICCCGTGMECPKYIASDDYFADYLGTVQDGMYVWHFFDITKVKE